MGKNITTHPSLHGITYNTFISSLIITKLVTELLRKDSITLTGTSAPLPSTPSPKAEGHRLSPLCLL